MKKKINWGVVTAVTFISVFALLLALLIYMLNSSYKLREFKVDLYVLCNEADICVADSDEVKVRVDSDNLAALYSIVYAMRGYFTIGNPEVTETLNMNFSHNGDDWNLQIGRAGDNRLLVNLNGPRSYRLYLKDNKKFEDIKRCVSADGFNTANRLIGNKK
ncbi:hypothetical protein [Butyrivibrio sp. JL13D10]|uniref:hypothetical protein n=1 Tax=Butyrivibrio sp. JL13D10 TaxID=3236815 RepID=UPI0038B64A47